MARKASANYAAILGMIAFPVWALVAMSDRAGGGEVAEPGADHVQRLAGICRGCRAHLGHLLAGTGRRCGR